MSKPHYYDHRERLRSKYLEKGINSLNDYEILELLLTFSIPVKDVKPQAKELLDEFGSIKEIIYNIDKDKFLSVKGIGDKSLILFSLIKDILKKITYEELKKKDKIEGVQDVVTYCKNSFFDLKKEVFQIIFLNSKNEILSIETIEEGIINEAYIYLRKIFEKAFKNNATAMILIHNHPGGKASPSKEDINITKKIIALSEQLNIVVHDHVIIAVDKYYSFKEDGKI